MLGIGFWVDDSFLSALEKLLHRFLLFSVFAGMGGSKGGHSFYSMMFGWNTLFCLARMPLS